MGVIFTKHCILCGKGLHDHKAFICSECVPKLEGYRLHNPSVNIPDADGAVSALRYRGAVQNAMKEFKFYNRPDYAEWFADQVLQVLPTRLDDWKPSLITFAPMGFMRYRKRGYNQAQLLAKFIARKVNLPCKSTLRKRFFVGKQSRCENAEARWINAQNMFKPIHGVQLMGEHVIFVDDIITTGATASAAVALIREMGAEKVYVASPTKA